MHVNYGKVTADQTSTIGPARHSIPHEPLDKGNADASLPLLVNDVVLERGVPLSENLLPTLTLSKTCLLHCTALSLLIIKYCVYCYPGRVLSAKQARQSSSRFYKFHICLGLYLYSKCMIVGNGNVLYASIQKLSVTSAKSRQ